MGKRMERVLAPVINEFRTMGLLDRWEREREQRGVQKTRRRLNKAIREGKRASLKTMRGKGA